MADETTITIESEPTPETPTEIREWAPLETLLKMQETLTETKLRQEAQEVRLSEMAQSLLTFQAALAELTETTEEVEELAEDAAALAVAATETAETESTEPLAPPSEPETAEIVAEPEPEPVEDERKSPRYQIV